MIFLVSTDVTALEGHYFVAILKEVNKCKFFEENKIN